ncbi:hypothetical protein LTR28_003241 [Elasticomyces elasticus]|nr:hypothetical protein LTR28_003241 [Elasticomyces elasticus]
MGLLAGVRNARRSLAKTFTYQTPAIAECPAILPSRPHLRILHGRGEEVEVSPAPTFGHTSLSVSGPGAPCSRKEGDQSDSADELDTLPVLDLQDNAVGPSSKVEVEADGAEQTAHENGFPDAEEIRPIMSIENPDTQVISSHATDGPSLRMEHPKPAQLPDVPESLQPSTAPILQTPPSTEQDPIIAHLSFASFNASLPDSPDSQLDDGALEGLEEADAFLRSSFSDYNTYQRKPLKSAMRRVPVMTPSASNARSFSTEQHPHHGDENGADARPGIVLVERSMSPVQGSRVEPGSLAMTNGGPLQLSLSQRSTAQNRRQFDTHASLERTPSPRTVHSYEAQPARDKDEFDTGREATLNQPVVARKPSPFVLVALTPQGRRMNREDVADSSGLSELSRSPSPVHWDADHGSVGFVLPEGSPARTKKARVGLSGEKTSPALTKKKTTAAKSQHFAPASTPRKVSARKQDVSAESWEPPSSQKRSRGRKQTDTADTPTAKQPRTPARARTRPFPSLSAPRFGLIQEELASDPFRLLIAVTLLNKTTGRAAVPVFRELMETYPTPSDLAGAEHEDVSQMIYHLGFQNQRAEKLIRLAQTWVEQPPTRGRRFRTRDYPVKGDHRPIKPKEILDDADECAGALEVGHFPGCGPYAWDSWRIFCRDKLRGVADGYNKEGNDAPEFEPEWKRVVPLDKELRACLKWMWLREGWEWDPSTGEKKLASSELLSRAIAGTVDWNTPLKTTTEDVDTKQEADQTQSLEHGANNGVAHGEPGSDWTPLVDKHAEPAAAARLTPEEQHLTKARSEPANSEDTALRRNAEPTAADRHSNPVQTSERKVRFVATRSAMRSPSLELGEFSPELSVRITVPRNTNINTITRNTNTNINTNTNTNPNPNREVYVISSDTSSEPHEHGPDAESVPEPAADMETNMRSPPTYQHFQPPPLTRSHSAVNEVLESDHEASILSPHSHSRSEVRYRGSEKTAVQPPRWDVRVGRSRMVGECRCWNCENESGEDDGGGGGGGGESEVEIGVGGRDRYRRSEKLAPPPRPDMRVGRNRMVGECRCWNCENESGLDSGGESEVEVGVGVGRRGVSLEL